MRLHGQESVAGFIYFRSDKSYQHWQSSLSFSVTWPAATQNDTISYMSYEGHSRNISSHSIFADMEDRDLFADTADSSHNLKLLINYSVVWLLCSGKSGPGFGIMVQERCFKFWIYVEFKKQWKNLESNSVRLIFTVTLPICHLL